MTADPGLEPWLVNGFPPPSFVVETERVTVGAGGPPLESRLLIGGAVLGVVLLLFGLILMAQGGGGGETALNTAPETVPTSSIPVLIFPPVTFEGSFLVPDETVPLPTLPVAPQIPVFQFNPTPGTTQGPPTTKMPDGPTTVPTTVTTTSTSTSTTAAATPPNIKSLVVEPSPGGDRCAGGQVRAEVTDVIRIDSVTIRVNDEPTSEMKEPAIIFNETRSGIWTAAFNPTAPREVKLTVRAANGAAATTPPLERTFRCP